MNKKKKVIPRKKNRCFYIEDFYNDDHTTRKKICTKVEEREREREREKHNIKDFFDKKIKKRQKGVFYIIFFSTIFYFFIIVITHLFILNVRILDFFFKNH